MKKLKVLYVSSSISPFLEIATVSKFVQEIPKYMQENGIEIRILVPRFGIIGVRKNRIHEVVRLSGINVKVGEKVSPLVIRASSIRAAKLQVYFVDSEEYFGRKFLFHDDKNRFFHDNDERIIFFCRGILETIKTIEWKPDIIHCHDWISSLIPMYLKTCYCDDAILGNTKSIFTIYNNTFADTLDDQMINKLNVDLEHHNKLQSLLSANFQGLMNTAIEYADMSYKAEDIDKTYADNILRYQDYPIIADNNDGLESYYDIYQSVCCPQSDCKKLNYVAM